MAGKGAIEELRTSRSLEYQKKNYYSCYSYSFSIRFRSLLESVVPQQRQTRMRVGAKSIVDAEEPG